MKRFWWLAILALVSLASAEVLFSEDFFDGNLEGWTREPGEIGLRWVISSQRYYNGPYGAICPKGNNQDERLISPAVCLTAEVSIKFYWATSYTWFVSPHNNGDFRLEIREAGGPGGWVELWNEEADGPFENWVWNETEIDIGPYWYGHDVQFAWRVIAHKAADVWLDTITVYSEDEEPEPDPDLDIEEVSFGRIKAAYL